MPEPSPTESGDEDFPYCCRYCPYRQPVSGACEHEFRQALAHQFASAERRTCDVYASTKTRAMRSLLASLETRSGDRPG